MENGLSLLPRPAGRFPQVSGIAVEFDLARAPGSRITAMQVGGAPLDEGKTYRVAVLDFLARGGDDYTMFRDAAPHHARQRRAAAGERGGGLSAQDRDREDGGRGTDRGE